MKKFNFIYTFYDRDTLINDQNVVEYHFLNYGQNVVINNCLLLTAPSPNTRSEYKETINEGEKTVTQYRLKFANSNPAQNKLLVISKVFAS